MAVGARDTPRSRSAHVTGREQATASPRHGSEREKPSFHKAALKKGEAREMHDFQNEQGRPAPRLTPGAPELLGRRLRSPAQGWDRQPSRSSGHDCGAEGRLWRSPPNPLLSLSLSHRGTRAVPASPAPRGSRGPEALRSVRYAACLVAFSQMPQYFVYVEVAVHFTKLNTKLHSLE